MNRPAHGATVTLCEALPWERHGPIVIVEMVTRHARELTTPCHAGYDQALPFGVEASGASSSSSSSASKSSVSIRLTGNWIIATSLAEEDVFAIHVREMKHFMFKCFAA